MKRSDVNTFEYKKTGNGGDGCCVECFLVRINKMNVLIQASTVDLITVADLYECLCKFFVAERENFKYFEEKAMEISMSKQYTKDMGKR